MNESLPIHTCLAALYVKETAEGIAATAHSMYWSINTIHLIGYHRVIRGFGSMNNCYELPITRD